MKTKEMRAIKLPAGPRDGLGNSDGLRTLLTIFCQTFQNCHVRKSFLFQIFKLPNPETSGKRETLFQIPQSKVYIKIARPLFSPRFWTLILKPSRVQSLHKDHVLLLTSFFQKN